MAKSLNVAKISTFVPVRTPVEPESDLSELRTSRAAARAREGHDREINGTEREFHGHCHGRNPIIPNLERDGTVERQGREGTTGSDHQLRGESSEKWISAEKLWLSLNIETPPSPPTAIIGDPSGTRLTAVTAVFRRVFTAWSRAVTVPWESFKMALQARHPHGTRGAGATGGSPTSANLGQSSEIFLNRSGSRFAEFWRSTGPKRTAAALSSTLDVHGSHLRHRHEQDACVGAIPRFRKGEITAFKGHLR
ncbi:hypothetical protein C8F04DRAFT_1178465 [Mycena alexandri]|uniref:Uncharacterized protein n=1 Tax=Mycena alexandri TaxID=1745969 RepID=A0AAD6T6C2_9AGAR|nr:hypothetical protein C8F04DRAFT_1178465 [Mycena alexandri]